MWELICSTYHYLQFDVCCVLPEQKLQWMSTTEFCSQFLLHKHKQWEEQVVNLCNVKLTHYVKHISTTFGAYRWSLVDEVVTNRKYSATWYKNCPQYNWSINGIPWWIDRIISLQSFHTLCRIVEYRFGWKINNDG